MCVQKHLKMHNCPMGSIKLGKASPGAGPSPQPPAPQNHTDQKEQVIPGYLLAPRTFHAVGGEEADVAGLQGVLVRELGRTGLGF